MKKLTLIRHAKSSWSDFSLADEDRPLNKRGQRDAPFMAALMFKNGWLPKLFVCSTANRAQSTCAVFVENIPQEKSVKVISDPNIYMASVSQLLRIVKSLPNEIDHIALVGHNPGFTQLANYFIADGYLDNLPTCGIVEIEGKTVEEWTDFNDEKAVVKEVHYPKKYQ